MDFFFNQNKVEKNVFCDLIFGLSIYKLIMSDEYIL